MMDEIRIFEKENTISFFNRKKMIQFVSKYMTVQYKRFLEQECAMAMDSEEEICYWEIKNSSCISRFERALKIILYFYLMFNKNFEIDN